MVRKDDFKSAVLCAADEYQNGTCMYALIQMSSLIRDKESQTKSIVACMHRPCSFNSNKMEFFELAVVGSIEEGCIQGEGKGRRCCLGD